uniref:Secretoglobin family 1D member 1 n=1 Tax=Nomascus leucogenys TaxID=61853 RepID=G1QTC4_NOMLE
MRLSVCLLLLTLALCGYRANAVVCQSYWILKSTGFLLAGKTCVQVPTCTSGSCAAKMKLKKCVDMMAYEKRVLITETLGKIAEKCDR